MKKIITAVLLCAATLGAQTAGTNAGQKKKAAAPPPAITIPKDAVPDSNGLRYTWTDKDGTKWLFVKTPFGITKSPASVDSPNASAPAIPTKAIDKGDTVRFERPGPFGTIAWEKKKTELTDDERKILDAQNAKTEQKSGQLD